VAERITRRAAFGVAFLSFAAGAVRVRLDKDGTVTAFTSKVEMGQGAQTELIMAVAEEMNVPLSRVRLVMGDTALCPDDGGTWASLTTPETVPAFRNAAAATRSTPLTAPDQWKVLGRSTPDVRGHDIVTGRQTYPSDLHPVGLLHARVLRPEEHTAALISVDAAEGIRIVRDGDLAAVVSPDPHTVRYSAVSAKWKPETFPVDVSKDRELAAWFKANSTPPVENMATRYPPLIRRGDAARALAESTQKHRSQYWVPYIAHAPMEPRAAIAEWKDDAVEIRSGSQAAFAVRAEVARALGIPDSKVRIIASGPGGAFGGKQRGEIEIEAARIARSAGKPVKLQWSREEEFTRAYHRPAGVIEIESALDDNGRISAWVHRNYNSGASGLATPYNTPNVSCEFHRCPPVVRQGSYRSLAAAANTLARESHIDELAALRKIDPLEFRMRNIADTRLKAVLEKLGSIKGGLACTIEKEARIALRAEVEIASRTIRVKRLVYAGDYGAVLNPLNLRKQIAGALVQGLGGALFERVDFQGATQKNRRLSQYRVPRFSDIPEIRIELIDRREVPSAGAGEAGITLIAPAIANAVFQQSGKRLRDLPLAL
jgi:isoquinoline 1-oxidoreductase